MRQLLSVAIAGGLGGCSLIYNPSNLPAPQGEAGVMVDAEIILDANPAALALTAVSPATLDEGAGVDGSRLALLAITGVQIVPGATVTVARSGGGATTASVISSMTTVADDNDMIAVPIKIDIDPNLGPSKPLPMQSYMLDVTVTNPGGTAKTLAAAVKVVGYDELTGVTMVASGVHRYSQVNIASLAAADTTNPLSIRSNSSITITGAVTASAAGIAPGPGGGAGGAAGSTTGAGGDGTGIGKGLHDGGGGGFATAGGPGSSGAGGGANLGDVGLKSLAANRGSGGAGGTATLGAGGVGGGGGGTIELSAAGALKVASIVADGSAGTTTANTGATAGGGGSGGAILLRWAGALQQSPTLSAIGGTAPTGGGKGGDGRIRIDASSMTDTATATPTAYHGPMFLATTALIVPTAAPTIRVTCEKNTGFSYYLIDPQANTHAGPAQVCGTDGKEDIILGAPFTPLGRGINRICISVPGAGVEDATSEDRNCIDLVYVFKL